MRLTVGLCLLLRFHGIEALPSGLAPDIGFIDDMGWLMVWGTALLYVDAILIILLYEKLGRSFGQALFPRILLSVACILTFDQIGFFAALHFVTGAPVDVLIGGWAGKMAAALLYSLMLVAYFRFVEAERLPSPRGLSGIFGTLTYRERYEALVERAGRDGLTALLHRGRFDELGEQQVASCLRTGRALTLLVIDVDHFKSINDRFGHTRRRPRAEDDRRAAGARGRRRGQGVPHRRRGIRRALRLPASARQTARRKHPAVGACREPGAVDVLLGQHRRRHRRRSMSAALPICSRSPTSASMRQRAAGATAWSATGRTSYPASPRACAPDASPHAARRHTGNTAFEVEPIAMIMVS